jgi:RNA polymerase sigma factor (sigma-70 family)
MPAPGERPVDPNLINEGLFSTGDPEEDGLRAAEVDAIRCAIDSLPPDQRDIINGLYYEGCTVAELARRQGVPRHRIYAELQRAERALVAALGSPDDA